MQWPAVNSKSCAMAVAVQKDRARAPCAPTMPTTERATSPEANRAPPTKLFATLSTNNRAQNATTRPLMALASKRWFKKTTLINSDPTAEKSEGAGKGGTESYFRTTAVALRPRVGKSLIGHFRRFFSAPSTRALIIRGPSKRVYPAL